MTRAGRVQPRDAGAGLVEVMVGIAIFAAVTGLLTSFAVEVLRSGAGVKNRLANVDQLRVAMDEMSKGLRIALRPEQVDPGCVTADDSAGTPVTCDVSLYVPDENTVAFYANYGDAAGPRLVSYRVEEDDRHAGTGQLVATTRSAGAVVALTSPACETACTTRTLARGLTWPVPVAAFRYAGLDCETFTDPPAVLPAALPATVSCVAIDLRVAGARDNPDTSVTSTVFLPNSVIGR